MSEDQLVSLYRTAIWAAAFVASVYIFSASFAPLIRRSLDQDARGRANGKSRQLAASRRRHRSEEG